VFERFAHDARLAVVRARDEAAAAGQPKIGCEHLVVGLLAEPGPAAAALGAAGADLAGLRARLPRTQLAQPDPLDADALATLGIDLDAVRRAADAAFGPGALDRPVTGGRLRRKGGPGGLTPDLKKAIEIGLSGAVRQRQRHISGGHLLVGVIDQGHNGGLDLLAAAEVNAAALRADVLSRIAAAA
jgi:ATP-dependent Clp protease ATP-binding subunit ClpA